MFVHFRYLKLIVPVVFAVNGAAFFFSPTVTPWFLLANLVSLGFLAFCVRCRQCSKSPFIIRYRTFRIADMTCGTESNEYGSTQEGAALGSGICGIGAALAELGSR